MAQAQQQVEQPQEFTPKFNRQQTRQYINLYGKAPNRFNPEFLNSVRQHAQYHNVPFYEGDFSILESIKQAGAGFIEGFTTLNIAEHPDNEWEAVFRSVGHLAGFAPGILSAPLTRLGMIAGAKPLIAAGTALRGVKGAPLYAASKLTKKASPLAKTIRDSAQLKKAAENSAVFKYLRSPEASDIISGAFTLGTASAISSWQQGTDAMLDSFFSGAIAGGVFKTIGNRIVMKDPKAEKYARGLAGSLFMGLPATARGATTPEQIYEYLMGAYFGGSERSWKQTESGKWLNKGIKREGVDPEFKKDFDPMRLEGFAETDPQVKELTYRAFENYQNERLNQYGAVAYEILKQTNQLDRIPGKTKEEKLKSNYIKEQGKKILEQEVDKEIVLKEEVESALKESVKGKGLYIISPGTNETQEYITKEASKRGITSIRVTHPQEPPAGKKRPQVFDMMINQKDVVEGDKLVKKAIEDIISIETSTIGSTTLEPAKFNDYVRDSINRDARSVKNSDSVIAFDGISSSGSTTQLSRIPVQVGINLKKPTYVFDKKFLRWFKFSPESKLFEPLETGETPLLKSQPAFFGGKSLDKVERTALKELFELKSKQAGLGPVAKKQVIENESDDKKTDSLDDVLFKSRGTESNSISTLVQTKLKEHSSEIKDVNDKALNLKGKELNDKLTEVEDVATNLASKYITKTKATNSKEFIGAIENELDLKLPEAFKLGLRKYLKRQDQIEPRRFIRVNETSVEIIPTEASYTFGNKTRNQNEPPTFLEEYYKTIKPTKDPIVLELDALTHNEQDYNLSNFVYVASKVEANKLRRLNTAYEMEDITVEKEALKNQLIKNAVSQMNKKGYHLYGGVNDKDKLQFVKYHPNYKKVDLIKKGFNDKTIPKSIYKHAELEYGLTRAQHNDMMRSIIAYGEALNEVPIETMAKNQSKFINNAVNQNKRAQIWMTNGLSGDNVFIRSNQHNEKLYLSKAGNYKGTIIDAEGNSKDLLNSLNIQLPQGTDGAIIATKATVNAMNKDGGMPETGSNKSFLIQRSPDGTILGKYMIVTVPDKYSKMMEAYKNTNPEHKDGLNFLMYKSGIKQTGDKRMGDYAIENGKLKLIGNPDVFEIEPSSFKYSQSVLNNNEMLGLNAIGNKAVGITLIKQLMTSQHPNMFSEVNAKVISDMYDTIIQRAYDGSPSINNKVMDYINKPSEKTRAEILENFQDIGLPEIFKILKSKGKENQQLAQDLMQEIVKVHKESVNSLRESGELSGPEAQDQLTEALEFTSAADKALKLISSIEGAYPLYLDKSVRPYVGKALRRFVGQRVLTPKVKNAGVFRMRPYDKFMQIEFPEFNNDALAMKKYGVKSDEIFRLGDVARNMLIQTDIVKGKTEVKLGDLWDKTKTSQGPRTSEFYKKNKEKLEDIFEALSVRVPQDSPSGAQILKFVGFTGVKNHEVLLHSRAMEAQGGADLDGDESFIYFGGRKSSEHGMKKEWKDMFKAQKKEFYTQSVTTPGQEPSLKEGFSHQGKGTPQGDGKDKAMRKVADSAIVELSSNIPSSSKTTIDMLGSPNKNSSVIMLARNGALRNKPLSKETKLKILEAHFNNAKFVVGDMPGVDSAFIKYLNTIGADYTVYHAGSKSRINPSIHKSLQKIEIKDAKKQYRKKITLTEETAELEGLDPDFIKQVNSNFYAQFSPAVRAFSGRRTAESRGQMGPVVVMTSNFRQAWSSLANSSSKKDVETYVKVSADSSKYLSPLGKNLGSDIIYRKYIIPLRKSEHQRDLTKALINFTADPANETGLIKIQAMQKLLNDAYFNKTGEWEVKGKKYKDTIENRNLLGISTDPKQIGMVLSTYSKLGLEGSRYYGNKRYNLVKDINSAFFGKNRVDSRNWTNYEIQQMTKDISNYPANERTTAMFKFANTLKELNIGMSPFDWVNPIAYKNRMQEYNKVLKESNFPEDKFKDLLLRTKIRQENSPQVDFITKNDLHIEKNQHIEAFKEFENPGHLLKLFKKAGVGEKRKVSDKYLEEIRKSIEDRGALETIRRVLNEAEDYYSNSLHNMATLDLIVNTYNRAEKSGNKISDAEVNKIVKRVDEFKEDWSEKNKARRAQVDSFTGENMQDVIQETNIKQLKMQVDKINKRKSKIKPTALMKKTRLDDLGTIDANIAKFKSTLKNPYSKDLFDAMLIGSLRPSSESHLKTYKSLRRKRYPTSKEKDILKTTVKEGAEANQHQLYLDSTQISPKVIRNFFKIKNNYFLGAQKPDSKVEFDKKVKSVEKEVEKFEPNTSIVDEGSFIERVQGYKGIKEGKLDKEQSMVVAELMDNIKRFNLQGQDMNALLGGIYTRIDPQFLPLKLNQMTTRDFKLINNWFNFMRQGTMAQKLKEGLSLIEQAKLAKLDWYEFPLTTNRKMMKFDMIFLPKQGYFRGKAGELVEKGIVLKPTYYGEILQDTIGKVQDAAQGEAFKLANKFTTDIQYLKQGNVAEDGNAIWRMAIRKLELPNDYGIKKITEKVYHDLYQKSKRNNNWDKIKDKQYIVDFGKGTERETIKGSDLIDKTKNIMNDFFKEMHVKIAGVKNEQGEYAWEKYRIGWYDGHKENPSQPILNYKAFLMDINKAMAKGEEFNMDLGIDGMRHMAKAMAIDLHPVSEYIGVHKTNFEKVISKKNFFKLNKLERKKWRPYKEAVAERYSKLEIFPTNYREGYFPHFYPETSRIKKMRDAELDALQKDTQMTTQEKERALSDIIFKYKTRTGDWDYGDYADWQIIRDNILPGAIKMVEAKVTKGKDKVRIQTVVPRMGNQFTRENHIPGWDIDPVSVQTYVNNVTNTYFRQLGNLLNTYTLYQMKDRMTKKWVKGNEAERKDGANLVDGWVNFWKQYVSEAMGNPTIIPKELYNNPNAKIEGTLYGAFADNIMAEKVNKVIEKLKIRKDKKVEKYFEDYSQTTGKDAYDMRRWSQVEAQWELATLMTHPKTPINNIFGGTLHTASSAGFKYLKKARDLDYLKTISPEFDSWDKVNNYMEKIGVGPQLLAHEYGLDKRFKEGAALAFTRELADKFGGKKDASLKDIISLKNKHGVSRRIVDAAVPFMSIPEKALRRDAYMSHFIKGWERLNGAVKNPYDPILIEMGKKGVKATQFLYSAAYRQPFARSGLGKIMSRFQLWSWNAMRFRKDLYHDAKIYGFKGSEAMDKFKRTMAIDAFVFALSSVFMYSLFDQILPAPWNYLQDTAQWMFGDEEQRNRAFFGSYPTAIAPLAMVTPPIARLPISVIREFSDDEYNKLADYYIWTMLPFGRMLRDVAHPEKSIFDNPMRIPEKVFGVPLTGMAKEAKRMKETEDKNPVPGFKMSSY